MWFKRFLNIDFILVYHGFGELTTSLVMCMSSEIRVDRKLLKEYPCGALWYLAQFFDEKRQGMVKLSVNELRLLKASAEDIIQWLIVGQSLGFFRNWRIDDETKTLVVYLRSFTKIHWENDIEYWASPAFIDVAELANYCNPVENP